MKLGAATIDLDIPETFTPFRPFEGAPLNSLVPLDASDRESSMTEAPPLRGGAIVRYGDVRKASVSK